MATLSQLISAVNAFITATGLGAVSKVTLDTVLNTIELKLFAQTDLDKVVQILQNYSQYQTITEGLGWYVSKITHEGKQPLTSYKFSCYFEGVLQ